MARVEGKIAIVTGSAAGIGAAAAALLAEGATVILADIDDRGGEETARQIGRATGRPMHYRHLDVSDENGWLRLQDEVVAAYGRIDILVNNAGIQMSQPLEEISLADWRRVFSIDVEGAFLGTRFAIERMKLTGGGSIVNVSSTFAMVADGLNAHYCASKAALAQFTKAAALYCADRNYEIRVNSVHPGVIRTPMLEREIRDVAAERGQATTEAVEAEWAKLTPLGIGLPVDIAEGIVYLASDQARYMTGAELVIDGGHIIR